mmetsp:Transcript_17966/g.33717  ORF Transcript_17966/g.33717 Transcript_17966/m.33717 type:complete len:394 (+) Transcript_17966:134-1315(+)
MQDTITQVFDSMRAEDDCISVGDLMSAMQALGMNPTHADVDDLSTKFHVRGRVDATLFRKLMEDALMRWTRVDQAKDLMQCFEAFDVNGSGQISVEKLVQIMNMSGNAFTSSELEDMLHNAGVTGDGNVSYKDLILKHFFGPDSGVARGDWKSLQVPVPSVPPLQEATTLREVAKLKQRRGDVEDALRLYAKALAILQQVHGPQHADVAAVLNSMAGAKEAQNHVEEALNFYDRALSIREKVLGPTHFYVAMTLDSIANLKDRLEQTEEAVQIASRSLSIWERVFGPTHPHIAKILFNLASRLDGLGYVDQPLAHYHRALDIQEGANPESEEVADIVGAIANMKERLGEIPNALNCYRRELDIRQKLFGESHPEVLELHAIIASLQTPGGGIG